MNYTRTVGLSLNNPTVALWSQDNGLIAAQQINYFHSRQRSSRQLSLPAHINQHETITASLKERGQTFPSSVSMAGGWGLEVKQVWACGASMPTAAHSLRHFPPAPLLLLHHNGSETLWKDFPKCRRLFGLLWTETVSKATAAAGLEYPRGPGREQQWTDGMSVSSRRRIVKLREFWWEFSVI